jgi:chorismate mutase
MTTRGIRAAITIHEDTPDAIYEATRELLQQVSVANPTLDPKEIASIIFTVTEDINSAYPAAAARQLGWHIVPLMCAREINVPGSLPRCIRILIHWNTEIPQESIQHVYLKDAKKLRPDLDQVIIEKQEGA